MRKTFVMAALLGCISLQASAEVVGDTIEIKNVDKVRIENTAGEQRIFIEGARFDHGMKYNQTVTYDNPSEVKSGFSGSKDADKYIVKPQDPNKWDKWSTNGYINLGLGALTGAPDGYDFKLWPSWELGIGLQEEWRPYGKKNVWSLGFGIGWRRYKIKDDKYLDRGFNLVTGVPTDMLVPTDFPQGAENKSSSLSVFSLQVPVTYTHYFTDEDGWGITLGGIVNFNTGAHANHSYSQGDYDHDIDVCKIGQRPVTIDLLAMVRIPSFVDVYFKYSPTKLFKSGRGPEVNQLSFGVWF